MCLVLEVGKVYLNKLGEKVEIVHHVKGCLKPDERPMVGVKESRGCKEVVCYELNGSVPNSSMSLIRLAPTPHPHAESMMLYALDAAECEKPWLRWALRHINEGTWYSLSTNPNWSVHRVFERKSKQYWPPEAY